MRLPSGRELAYPSPKIIRTDRGERAVSFMVKDDRGKWAEYKADKEGKGKGAYGGTWTENAVSGIARDLLVAAMPRLEAAGYKIVLHTHDDICAEVPDGFGSIEEFTRLMTILPDWAEGLPVAVEAHEGPRFCEIESSAPELKTPPEPEPTAPEPEPKALIEITDGFGYDFPVEPPAIGTVEEQFIAAIERAKLAPPGRIIADGEIHRFVSSNDKPGRRNGWYFLYDLGEGLAAGMFGCWRAEIKERWLGKSGQPLTDEDRELADRRSAEVAQKFEEEQKKAHAEAREEAVQIWDSAAEAPADHPYLRKKGVRPHGLRVCSDGRLIVPVYDAAGALQSLQYIAANGDKRFETGGRVKGCHFIIGEPDGVLAIAEGFGTAATIHEDVGHAVAACFNSGNLPPAAEGLRTNSRIYNLSSVPTMTPICQTIPELREPRRPRQFSAHSWPFLTSAPIVQTGQPTSMICIAMPEPTRFVPASTPRSLCHHAKRPRRFPRGVTI
jgi:hypothetical protein